MNNARHHPDRAPGSWSVDVAILDDVLDDGGRCRLADAEELCRQAALDALAAAPQAARRLGGFGRAGLSVALVDDATSKALNLRYRGRAAATNVLAFAATGGGALLDPPADADLPRQAGDIVVALPCAQREARLHGLSLRAYVARLIVHGVAHLLGYGHAGAASVRAMARVERAACRRGTK